MKMVGNQSPGVAGGVCFGKDKIESFKTLIIITVIKKYRTTVDTSDDDVVQGTGSIYAGFARHDLLLTPDDHLVNLFIYLWA
jgi:hypothetical protein